jgi:hypothetical protein
MPRAAFEPATPATKRPQTYALDRAATGIGHKCYTSQDWSVLQSTKTCEDVNIRVTSLSATLTTEWAETAAFLQCCS